MKMKSVSRLVLLGIGIAFSALSFQNCAPAQFNKDWNSEILVLGIPSFFVWEDNLLSDQIKDTLAHKSGVSSVFYLLKNTQHGKIDFNKTNASFTYTPDPNYFGNDQFDFSETASGAPTPVVRTAYITVGSVNDLPWIVTDSVNLEMGLNAQKFQIEARDREDGVPEVWLDLNNSTSVQTALGTINKVAGGFTYTPSGYFIQSDKHEFIAHDHDGGISKKVVGLNVQNTLQKLQPALAIRGAGCMSCHAQISSTFITDFGYNSPSNPGYFLNQGTGVSFSGEGFFGNSRISDPGSKGGSYATSTFYKDIYVPKNAIIPAGIKSAEGTELIKAANTIADYVRSIEALKPTPAPVVEKDIYIGAPSAERLAAVFGAGGSSDIIYRKSTPGAPELSGLNPVAGQPQAWSAIGKGSGSTYLTCEGDVYVPGTVRLNEITIKTQTGCRIYATGSVFIDGAIDYERITKDKSANLANLQVVSSRAIYLGIGTSHCENLYSDADKASGLAWYYSNDQVGNHRQPLEFRLAYGEMNRNLGARSWVEEAALIQSEAKQFGGITDASCRTNTLAGRGLSFERLLLNAPSIQSRYTGQFSGVIVSEVGFFSRSDFSFVFDGVFSNVPVLPFLREEDYLTVK